jgi:2-C-methyl-D-erythritol 4-phosphate cytidylyltransferase
MKPFSCVILAAGKGKRFGTKKQFVVWRNHQLWFHPYMRCKEVSDDVIVVGVEIKGGKYRQDSSKIGVEQAKYDRVVILEAARPAVTTKQIKKIGNKNHNNCTYAVKSTETIYNRFNGHIYRDDTFCLQTPQAFDKMKLLEAYDVCKGMNYTSDTEIYYNVHGKMPYLLKGNMNLMKVNYPYDLKILEEILWLKKKF